MKHSASDGGMARMTGNIRQQRHSPPGLSTPSAAFLNIWRANDAKQRSEWKQGERCSPFARDAARCTNALQLVVWDALPRRPHGAASTDTRTGECNGQMAMEGRALLSGSAVFFTSQSIARPPLSRDLNKDLSVAS